MPRTLPRLMHLGADFESHGLSAKPDWRYDLVCDYLKASPSYEAVRQALLGKRHKLYPLPTDAKVVRKVQSDFGDIYKMLEQDWWDKVGMSLYGVSAPLPKPSLVGRLSANENAVTARWTGHDSVVLSLPLDLSMPQVLKQVKTMLKDESFVQTPRTTVKPIYTLTPSKLSRSTLQNGLKALRLYKRGYPLWKIGNQLYLVPTMCFDEAELNTDRAHDYSSKKAVLGIAASRLIRTAALVAENAARGRFPLNKPFAEAVLLPYQRPAGRPIGSKAPKRKKADSGSRGFKSEASKKLTLDDLGWNKI